VRGASGDRGPYRDHYRNAQDELIYQVVRFEPKESHAVLPLCPQEAQAVDMGRAESLCNSMLFRLGRSADGSKNEQIWRGKSNGSPSTL
jgi:hypothetical protein